HGFLQTLDKSIEVHSAGTQPASQVNPLAIEVMKETGIDISSHTPKNVGIYLNDAWDYVITVCGGANETCPMFIGKVGKRLHIGFDDPSNAQGPKDYVMDEFRRVRDEIRTRMTEFYVTEILKREIPKCSCGGKC
ncbi:MAG: arsenate reductase ArsC, partial [Bacteroidaceae bacterium]|nr:arsenate reductase ArsC [Bacteroidaceae bacterium]